MNLILDCNNLFHRSYNIFKKNIEYFSCDNKEHSEQLIRKFIIDISYFANQLEVDNVYYCFDKRSFRKNIDSNYKANRNQKQESFQNTLNQAEQLLKLKQLNVIAIEGLEADDLMQLLVSKFDQEINIIISSDEDLRQLVNEKTFVVSPLNPKTIFTITDNIPFKIEKSKIVYIDPLLIRCTKIMKGCEGDNVLPLVERFTTKNIQLIVNELKKYNDNKYYLYLFNIKDNILKNYQISDNIFYKQLQLVYLDKYFLPINLVNEFNNFQFKKNSFYQFLSNYILDNTIYNTNNYQKKENLVV